MGLLLTHSAAVELELPPEVRAGVVSEKEAHANGPLRVLGCPRCNRRLCALQRDRGGGGSAALSWRVPSSRIERSWLAGTTSIRCRACGNGRVGVELFADGSQPPGTEEDEDRGASLSMQRVVLKAPSAALSFRPSSSLVCGIYDSAVQRAAELLQAEALGGRAPVVSRRTLRRSELSAPGADTLPAVPLELVVVVHRISGQRNPLTDSHGLYNAVLAHAWQRAEVVILCLLDVPTGGYLAKLLQEQPTLLGLLAAGRLLPLFAPAGETGGGEDTALSEGRPSDKAEAGWWLVRCLDGRVPRVEGGVQTLTHASSAGCNTTEARATASAAAEAGAASGSALAMLAPIAQSFEGWALARE